VNKRWEGEGGREGGGGEGRKCTPNISIAYGNATLCRWKISHKKPRHDLFRVLAAPMLLPFPVPLHYRLSNKCKCLRTISKGHSSDEGGRGGGLSWEAEGGCTRKKLAFLAGN
jgi:hypothetical protein